MCCSKCEKNLPIVNKKYNLCDNCNFARMHNGQSKSEVYAERALSKPIKTYQIKTNARPKQQTKKQADINKELSKLKREIELDAVQDNGYYCRGCGTSHPGLDKSHLLSIGQFKHLELVKINIQLLCRSCHLKWETKVIIKMIQLLCFWDNMKIVKELNIEEYNRYLVKINEYIKWLPEGKQKDALTVMSKDQ